jgi:hypothetical protein
LRRQASIAEELTPGTRLYLSLLVFESTVYTLAMAVEFKAKQLAGSNFSPPPKPKSPLPMPSDAESHPSNDHGSADELMGPTGTGSWD